MKKIIYLILFLATLQIEAQKVDSEKIKIEGSGH